MWMSSNVRTLLVRRDENNQISVEEVDESEVQRFQENRQEDFFMHPLLIALSHSLVVGETSFIDLEEEKNKLTEDEFKSLPSCAEITNCAICMENKKMIKRLPNPSDGRSVLIFLTAFGKEKRDDSRSVVLKFNHTIENQLSDIQIKHFFEVAECIMEESKKFEHF